MAPAIKIVVLEGDETGQELLEQSVRLLDPALLELDLELVRFDLSLSNRRETSNQVVSDAAGAMREAGLGLKAATITPEGADDVGSPNRILREEVEGKVIVRTGRRLPGVTPIAGLHYPISVVRMAVEDAYGAKQWREGEAGAPGEVAYRTERVTRSTCRAVAEYAFRSAEKMQARVYGGPNWTVSPVYEGMLKEEMDDAARRHPNVAYQPVLIDATYAGLLSGATDAPLVIPALNRDGDCLSDLVLPACGAILRHAADRHGPAAERASRAIYEGTLETIASGTKTPDLGGHAGTTEFTDAVIERVRTKLEVWSSLGTAP